MKLTPLHAWIAGKIDCEDRQFERQQLTVYQIDRLNKTLQLARQRSSFYARHLSDAPGQITTLDDLQSIPFTTADHIRSQGLQMLCVSQSSIQRVVTLDSSGTTGQPKRIYFTPDDQALTVDFFAVGMSTLVDPGDRVLILLPGERPGSVGDLLAQGLQRIGVTAIPHGPVHDPAHTLNIIARNQVNSLVGVPIQVLSLARYNTTYPIHIKSILLSTDHVPNAITRALQAIWGCEVHNHYGMTEMGLGGGVSCTAQSGYHLREADLYFEIIDPLSGQTLPDGETGEVVFTTLTRQGMPLIRYRTGDISRFIPGSCACGTLLKTLQWITHRTQQIIRLGEQLLTIADLDEALFDVHNLLNYQADISQLPNGKDNLLIDFITIAHRDDDLFNIQNALETIPTIKWALQSANLSIELHRQAEPGIAVSMAKRQILDHRR